MESADATGMDVEDAPSLPDICSVESCPGRRVFSEEGNPEAWIGTDLVVDVTE